MCPEWFGRVLTRPLIEAGVNRTAGTFVGPFGRVLTRPLIEAHAVNAARVLLRPVWPSVNSAPH